MNVRELAASDAKSILEDTEEGQGTEFILISKSKEEFPVVGSYGDIGYLLNPATGEEIPGRTIQAAYSMETLRGKTQDVPEKGWRFKTLDLSGREINLFVTMYEPDNTIGVARIRLALSE